MSRCKRVRHQSGQSIVEYGAVLAFVATLAGLLMITGMTTLVPAVSAGFTSVTQMTLSSEGGAIASGSGPGGGESHHGN